jgi:acetyl-CoA synthetase
MHRWKIPNDYNVAIDCLDRRTGLRDKVALIYDDDEGHSARYTLAQIVDVSNRFANALRALGIGRRDVVAIHTPSGLDGNRTYGAQSARSNCASDFQAFRS